MRRKGTAALALLVTGAAALVTGLATAPAQAASTLTATPPDTDIRALPLLVNRGRAGAAYGLQLHGVDTAKPVKIVVSSTTAGKKVFLAQQDPVNQQPEPTDFGGQWATPAVGTSVEGAQGLVLGSTRAGTEFYYLGAATAGVYSVVLYQEGPTGDQTHYSAADDPGALTLTLTSLDLKPSDGRVPVTSDTRDDATWSLTTTPSVVVPRRKVSVAVALPPLTTLDVRGTLGNGVPGNGDTRGWLGWYLGSGKGDLDRGPVTLERALGREAAKNMPTVYYGDFVGNDGLSHPTFKINSTVMDPGLLTVRAQLPHSTLTTTTQVGVPVTMTADETTVLLGSKVRLTGTADPRATVGIYVQQDRNPGGFLLATSVTANADGTFGLGTTPKGITSYQADVNGKTARVDIRTTTAVTAKAKALGGGKVQFTVNGKPSRTGYINVYDEDGVRIGHVKSDKYGDGVVVVQSTPGRRTFTAGFQVTGSDAGTTSITGTVK